MKYKLSDICYYCKEKVDVSGLTKENYISTENMLPDKNGVIMATSLPRTAQTRGYRERDVLVSNIRPYFKKIWFADRSGGCSNDVLVFRANKDVDSRYLYYVLADDAFFEYSMATSKGTKMPRGDKKALMEYKVIDYGLKDQRKIAMILSALDEKIKLNTEINKNLEQQAQAVFQNISMHSSSTAKLSQFVNIKHGFAFKGDYISFSNNNVVLVTPGNFKIGGGFQEAKCKYFSSSYPSDYVLHAGDLIVTMTDLSKEADTLGYGAFVPNNPDRTYLHNQRIGLVQFLNDELDKDYLYWYLRSYKYHMNIVGSASGSTVKHTSPGRIVDQLIPIPTEDYDLQISLLRSLDKAVSDNDVENRKLVELRDTLLPKLMSGEIDVSDIDL